MKTKEKGRIIGAIGAILVHLLLIGFLVWFTIVIPEPDEESGVPILMGQVDYAIGGERVDHYVDVDVLPEEPKVEPIPVETEEIKQELITQDVEETVALEPKKEKDKPKEKTPEELAVEAKKKEQERLERERKEAEEAKKREEQRIAKEQKAAEEAARRRVAGAFGKGAQMDGTNTASEKVKNAFDGIPSTATSSSGQSGYGTFDLGGRSIGKGGLPRPVYDVPEEGKVVVTIIVTPEGKVMSAEINKLTNTINPQLRDAAKKAAKKAEFNRINGVDNQIGSITYYFNLK